MRCEHKQFLAAAEVRRVGGRLLAGFRLKCRQCRVEFEFVNQAFGAVTADGLELLSEVRALGEGAPHPGAYPAWVLPGGEGGGRRDVQTVGVHHD